MNPKLRATQLGTGLGVQGSYKKARPRIYMGIKIHSDSIPIFNHYLFLTLSISNHQWLLPVKFRVRGPRRISSESKQRGRFARRRPNRLPKAVRAAPKGQLPKGQLPKAAWKGLRALLEGHPHLNFPRRSVRLLLATTRIIANSSNRSRRKPTRSICIWTTRRIQMTTGTRKTVLKVQKTLRRMPVLWL